MIESPDFQRENGKIGSKYLPRCRQLFANYVHCSFFFLQIFDHANIFQLPDAMKVTDAFIQSAQELLFDASSDVDADKVLQNISKIGKTWFDFFLQRVEFFVSKHSYVELLLRAYRTARSLLFRNEDGILVIHRVMDFCSECADLSQKCQSPKIPFSPLFIFAYRLRCHRKSISQ
jgi:hypothetical protein